MDLIRTARIYDLTPQRAGTGHIVYWMSREQRVSDNPALLFAIHLAKEYKSGISVIFTITGNYPGAFLRHYDFMLRGLKQVEFALKSLNIPFEILQGSPSDSVLKYAINHDCGTIITDFDPMRVKRNWVQEAINKSNFKFLEIDGHNIVPARIVSNKVEFAAYTLRPKIHKQLEFFLEDFPEPQSMDSLNYRNNAGFDMEELLDQLNIDMEVPPVDWVIPGEKNAFLVMREFIEHKLNGYNERRNDPLADHTSNLSPYLHFGQLFSGRIVIEILKNFPSGPDSDAFIEELVVRKELADNFCHFNKDYDNTKGFHEWAQKSHALHRKDEREYLYTREDFENAETHDPLWNASQLQMMKTGKMHGYMRMYWAKKILEWTRNIEEALAIAIFLNDKYELDGRDPNGYTGIAWSIGGVHDRAWTERPVFGKIRYMNYNGCKRKFDVGAYINKHTEKERKE